MNKKLIKQVAKVIGKKLAVHELSIVDSSSGILYTGNKVTVKGGFIWEDSPQGVDFWYDIDRGVWPYNYTRGES